MSAKTSPLLVKIENEVTTAGIQRCTESAMKELLGWYGYDSHEPIDIVTSNSSNLSAMALTHNLTSTIANDIGTTVTMLMSKRHRNVQPTDKMNNGNAVMENFDLTNAVPFKNATNADKQDDCGWCKRPVSLGSTEFLASPEGLIYCTESCFSQSRRASFKRAKTCDWCKHIRHAISYVDFQDGATQLQFCSDKCLNQYKMQIFCKETQAHLDMNPHLKEKGSSSTSSLITPELWLKDCQSRSVSPSNSDRSRSSTSPSGASQLVCSTPTNTATKQRQQRPIITVAPVSKLISRADCKSIHVPLRDEPTQGRSINSTESTRVVRTRRSQRLHLNVGHSVYRNACKNNGIGNEQNITRNANPCRSIADKFKTKTHASEPKPIQSSDIEMGRQSAARNLLQSLKSAPAKTVNSMQRHQLLPPPPDLYPLNSYHQQQRPLLALPHIGPTIPQTSSSAENRLPAIDAIPSPSPRTPIFGVIQTLPSPPMTLLVPCPIIVPFPIPIPVPLPFESFLKAAKIKLDAETAYPNHSKTPDSVLSDSDTFSMDLLNDSDHVDSNSFIEQPLDFTKEAAEKLVGEPRDGTPDTHIDIDSIDSQYDNNVENKFSSKLNSRSVAKRSFNRESERSQPLRKRKRIIDLITC